MTRRDWMLSTAALPAAAARGAQSNPKNIVVSSGNGARACARAMELLKAGADTLDAVIAGVNINEEDPEDTSVGYGGLPNEEGVVELDASVMHGPTRRAGSVASIRNIKTPSRVAKLERPTTPVSFGAIGRKGHTRSIRRARRRRWAGSVADGWT